MTDVVDEDRRDLDGVSPSTSMNDVMVFHPGRQHAYEVAVALQTAGRLQAFHTSVYYRPDRWPYRVIEWLPRDRRDRAQRRLAYRRHPLLSDERVRSWPYAELIAQTLGRVPALAYATRGWIGSPFHAWASDLHMSRWLGKAVDRPGAIYGFEGGSLRVFRQAKWQGIATILDIPMVADGQSIIETEAKAFGVSVPAVPGLERRKAKERQIADWAIVPSRAVAESVAKTGVPPERTLTVPFGVNVDLFQPTPKAQARTAGLRVVFAGKFSLRKGVQYAIPGWINAKIPGEFRIIGPPAEPAFVNAMRSGYRGAFTEVGNLLIHDLANELAAADVFVFPSLAEGSALVTYEALASGLPCIVTAESGSIVRDGVEGFVVPARDAGAITARLKLLADNADLRARMGRAARLRAEQFTWADYGRRLAAAVEQVLANA